MVKHRLVHVFASDTHHLKTRTFDLAEGYEALEKLTNETMRSELKKHALAMLLNEQIAPETPIKYNSKRFFGLF